MKTIIRITTDYNSDLSNNYFKDEVNYLVNEVVNCYCEVKNEKYINIVEEEKNYISSKEDFKNKTIIESTGYSQSDWQTYVLYHDLDENNEDLKRLIKELERSFTHFNDYAVEKFEQETINNKPFNSEPFDYTEFSIRHIEFPKKEDVLKEYIEIYGKDFDEAIIEID